MKHIRALLLTSLLTLSHTLAASTVLIETNLGDIEAVLFDAQTPVTTQNFLDYASSFRYDDTVIHRSVPGFVIQGGGYMRSGDGLSAIDTFGSIDNEAHFSNRRGTLAMAKLAGNANSATSQWFINLTDNSANLDFQNGGFTVFGQVVSGMAVVDAIAALPVFNAGNFSQMPLVNYSEVDAENEVLVDKDNFVVVHRVSVIDEDAHSADDYELPAQIEARSDSGAGSLDAITILLLFAFFSMRWLSRRGR